MFLLIISFIAIFTSTISLLPQILRAAKTKSVDDLSLLMLINFIICSVSWTVYGFITNGKTVWATNIIMTIFSIILLFFKLKYRKRQNEENN